MVNSETKPYCNSSENNFTVESEFPVNCVFG